MREFIALSLVLFSIPALAAETRDGTDWSGLYAGVKLAEGWGEAHLGTGRYDPAFPFPPTSVNLHGAGIGLSLGYDWQRENLIYGLGVDVLDTHIEGTTSLYTNPLPGVANGCDSARVNCPMGIKRARLGLIHHEPHPTPSSLACHCTARPRIGFMDQ